MGSSTFYLWANSVLLTMFYRSLSWATVIVSLTSEDQNSCTESEKVSKDRRFAKLVKPIFGWNYTNSRTSLDCWKYNGWKSVHLLINIVSNMNYSYLRFNLNNRRELAFEKFLTRKNWGTSSRININRSNRKIERFGRVFFQTSVLEVRLSAIWLEGGGGPDPPAKNFTTDKLIFT